MSEGVSSGAPLSRRGSTTLTQGSVTIKKVAAFFCQVTATRAGSWSLQTSTSRAKTMIRGHDCAARILELVDDELAQTTLEFGQSRAITR